MGQGFRGAGTPRRPGGNGDSLRGDLDELLEQLDAFVELTTQTHLGDHPHLQLVEAAQEQVQVGRGLLEVLPPERVVDQLMLQHRQYGYETVHRECTSITIHRVAVYDNNNNNNKVFINSRLVHPK